MYRGMIIAQSVMPVMLHMQPRHNLQLANGCIYAIATAYAVPGWE